MRCGTAQAKALQRRMVPVGFEACGDAKQKKVTVNVGCF